MRGMFLKELYTVSLYFLLCHLWIKLEHPNKKDVSRFEKTKACGSCCCDGTTNEINSFIVDDQTMCRDAKDLLRGERQSCEDDWKCSGSLIA